MCVGVLDLYMRAQLTEQVDMRAGMFKIPFGWEGLRSSRSTNTIELSDVTRALSSVELQLIRLDSARLGCAVLLKATEYLGYPPRQQQIDRRTGSPHETERIAR